MDQESGLVDWRERRLEIDQEPGLVRGGGCKMDQESGLVDWRERRLEIDQEPGFVALHTSSLSLSTSSTSDC